MRSATFSSELQSDISAKVLKERLDWCDVAKALSRREIIRHDDFLDVLVRGLIEIGFSRLPAPQPAIGILNAALLPGGIGITEPSCHSECIAKYSVTGKTGVVVEGDRLMQYRIKSFEDGHDRTGCLGGGLAGESGGKGCTGLAFMQHQHRPSALADDQIGLPVRLAILPGQVHDSIAAYELIKDIVSDQMLLADKAYDAISLRDCTPSPHLYKDRNLIERFFNKLKHFRRIATRYDKLGS